MLLSYERELVEGGYLLGDLVVCSRELHELPDGILLGGGERRHFGYGGLGPEIRACGCCWACSRGGQRSQRAIGPSPLLARMIEYS